MLLNFENESLQANLTTLGIKYFILMKKLLSRSHIVTIHPFFHYFLIYNSILIYETSFWFSHFLPRILREEILSIWPCGHLTNI